MSFRRLLTLLRREVRATLRDPFTVTVLILVPLVALASFSFVLSTEVEDLPLGVLDASASRESRRIVAELEADGSFAPRRYATRAALEEALVSGDVSAAIVFPPGFERALLARRAGSPRPEVQLLYDGAETVLAGNAEGFLSGLIGAAGAQLVGPDGAGGGVTVEMRALFNETLDGTPYMVAGTFGFVLSFLTTLITAVAIVNEKIGGTFDQLQLTPATNLEIFLGKLLPLGAMFALDVVLMMLVSGLLLGVWPRGNAIFFVAVSSFYVLTSLALGLFFSATSSTAAEAVQKTVFASVPLVQLSGFAFPIRNMPMPIQWLTELLPATHYIEISRAIYLRGAGPLDVLPQLAALTVFAALLIGGSLRSLSRRA